MKAFKRLLSLTLSLALALAITAAPAPAGAVEPSYTVSGAYGESVYLENLRNLTLTGDYRTDLVNVALTQVGYHEGADRTERHGGDLTSDGNWTEYGYYAQCDGYAWCAMFISWCARQARIPYSLLQDSTVARAYSFGLPFYLKEDYAPRTGDIIFFAEKGHVWDHVGIVMGVREGWVYTIEGNARNAVRIKRYTLDDEYIRGYGVYETADPQEDLVQRKRLYLLRYDLNGGQGKRTDQVALEDQLLCIYPNEEDEPNPDSDQPPENAHWCWKEGCSFEGWYLRRNSDGRWLTVNGWQDSKTIREQAYSRRLFADMDGFIIDESWCDRDFGEFTLYAVWRSEETGALENESAYIYRLDSQGWANPFRDLSEADIWYAPVKHLFQRGLLSGVEENRFGVSSSLTLAQLLALLHRASGSPDYRSVLLPYRDVQEGDWYYNAVCWACQLGMLRADPVLKPDSPLTRGAYIAVLYAWAVNTGRCDPTPEGDGTLALLRALITDRGLSGESTSPEALAWARKTGLLQTWGLNMPEALSRTGVTRLEGCGLLALYLERSGK